MKKKDFVAFLNGKTVAELLKMLELGLTGKQKNDPDFLDEIIDEINSRELTDAEAKEFENVINPFAEENFTQPEKTANMTSKEEITQLTTDKYKERELGKYTALKTTAGLISLLGYIVITIGVALSIYFSLQREGLISIIISFISSVVIALPLLAFSNLIHVFIDIEYNTRKKK